MTDTDDVMGSCDCDCAALLAAFLVKAVEAGEGHDVHQPPRHAHEEGFG